ncbi:hypothetical protein IL306_003961, partial [Fusarium sp. DS 682]
ARTKNAAGVVKGKGGKALVKSTGKSATRAATRSSVSAAVKTPPRKSPKKKIDRSTHRTRSQARADLRAKDKEERRANGEEPRTYANPFEPDEADLPPIVVWGDDHYELPCLACVRSCLAGKGEFEFCTKDKDRRARRCALYESGNHKCEPMYVSFPALFASVANLLPSPNLAEVMVRVLKLAIQKDEEAEIKKAIVAVRLQLDTWADKTTRDLFTKYDRATKPLVTIGEAAERDLAGAVEDDGDPDGGEAGADQKAAARKIIQTLASLL